MTPDEANPMDGIKGGRRKKEKKKKRRKMPRLTHEIIFPSGVSLKGPLGAMATILAL